MWVLAGLWEELQSWSWIERHDYRTEGTSLCCSNICRSSIILSLCRLILCRYSNLGRRQPCLTKSKLIFVVSRSFKGSQVNSSRYCEVSCGLSTVRCSSDHYGKFIMFLLFNDKKGRNTVGYLMFPCNISNFNYFAASLREIKEYRRSRQSWQLIAL